MESENPFVAEYQKAFPHVRLSIFQQELISASVSNGGAWKQAIIFWAGNGYRAESVFKVIEYYKDLMTQGHYRMPLGLVKSDPGRQTDPVRNDLPDCAECDNKRIIFPDGDWKQSYPCPKCSEAKAA